MVMNPMVSNPEPKKSSIIPYIGQIKRVLVAHVETHLFQNGGFETCKMIFTNLSFLLAMVCQAAYPRVPANRGE